MTSDTTLWVALVAGIISFLSPCVLPIIPGFLAYLAGSSVQNSHQNRISIFISSVFFVLGFSSVFASLGILLNTLLGSFAYDAQIWLGRIGGSVVIFFGLYLMGLIKFGFLQREHRVQVNQKFNSKYLTSFIFGAAFAAGWTPCVGAVLGAILALAATQPGSAFVLLLTYSIGLGIPFLIVGLFASQAAQFIHRYGRYVIYINRIFGAFLVILGVLVFTGTLSKVANFELLNTLLLN